MKILTITTKNAKHFTGSTIQKAFNRNGHIDLTFNITIERIRCIDVCGFAIDSDLSYYTNPKNVKQHRANANFKQRILDDLEQTNKDLLNL